MMVGLKTCLICKRRFLPSKYRRSQAVCSLQACQGQRQLNNLAAWREKNPGYFKVTRYELWWADVYRKRSRSWREKHRDKVRNYKKARKEEQKAYMREYMRRLRRDKKREDRET